MTYLSGKAQKKKKIIRYVLYAGVLLFVVFFWSSIKSSLYPVLEPVAIHYNALKKTLGSIPEFFSTYTTTREALIKKDKDLMIEIERLENQVAEKDARLKELNNIIQEGGSNEASTLVLYPLMQDITKLYSTILLSKGFKDGVEIDDYVYVRGLQPVCIIKEVNTVTSVCLLLSAPNVTTDAVTEGSSTVSLTLLGRGGGTFLANVPRDSPVFVGDKVLLNSDHAMTLGTVVDIIHNNQDTSWHVFVRGAYNPLTSSIFYIHKK